MHPLKRGSLAVALVAPPSSDKKVVPFAPQKRRRGRPNKPDVRKQPELQTPSTADFDHTCMAIAGIDKKVWVGAQKQVLRKASRDTRVPGYAHKVLMHQVYAIDRTHAYLKKRGKNWHGQACIAKEAGVAPRSVRAARDILQLCGYMLRRYLIKPGSHASKRWETTLPALVDAALEVTHENEGRKQKKAGVWEQEERHKKGEDRHSKSREERTRMPPNPRRKSWKEIPCAFGGCC